MKAFTTAEYLLAYVDAGRCFLISANIRCSVGYFLLLLFSLCLWCLSSCLLKCLTDQLNYVEWNWRMHSFVLLFGGCLESICCCYCALVYFFVRIICFNRKTSGNFPALTHMLPQPQSSSLSVR